jgi:23S rRNA (guanine2445-N2)-methyltransferase / 23S rRNA (guanine2069-N7)-methyltransferase
MTPPATADLRFFATAAPGAEALLADELREIAAGSTPPTAAAGTVRAERGGVSFSGDLALGYRVCLWSRLAQRVLLQLAAIPPSGDPDALWTGLAAVDWSDHLAPDGTLAVDFVGQGKAAGVDNTLYGAQRVKDVIVDQLRARHGRRPSVDLVHPDLRVDVHVGGREAVVAVDLSGESLHRRGYRTPGEQAAAPLKETLAATILVRAGWPQVAAADGSVVDPLCGSGTLPLEAALMAADVAPGLLREAAGPDGPRWGFAGWRGHDKRLWRELVAQAGERRHAALARLRAARSPDGGGGTPVPLAFGFDRDARAVELARAAVARAGLQDLVRVERRELAGLARPAELDPQAPGLVVANPPYGHRLGAPPRPDTGRERGAARRGRAQPAPRATRRGDAALADLYTLLGERLRGEFPGWSAAVLVADLELGKRLGMLARRANRLMNGPLPCTLLRFELGGPVAGAGSGSESRAPASAGPASRAGAPARSPAQDGAARRPAPPARRAGSGSPAPAGHDESTALVAAAAQFANRLGKNARHWGRLMRRAGVGCYRVYDADLPDFALAVDLYERWAHVQEYAPPPEVDEELAKARLDAALRVVPEVLGLAPTDVFLKVRTRQRGAVQYGRQAAHGVEHVVNEGDLRFLVNLTDYLDTGLFLQGRAVRRLLAGLATGQRFLNLFGYTGTATVAAARGGAADTTTVDLNGRYLAWAQRNFSLNKLKPARNAVVEADVLRWIAEADERFGLIYLDPPTFSNSKRMGRATFDVRRDHADLIRLVTRRLLTPGGVLVFACNARRFTLDADALAADFALEDLSAATLPPDFARRARSHHVWRVTARR